MTKTKRNAILSFSRSRTLSALGWTYLHNKDDDVRTVMLEAVRERLAYDNNKDTTHKQWIEIYRQKYLDYKKWTARTDSVVRELLILVASYQGD